MRQIKFLITLMFILVLSLTLVQAVASSIDQSRQQRLDFNHLIYISDITTVPSIIAPGQSGVLNFKLENAGNQFIKDVRVSLTLPAEIASSNDISKRKIAYMASAETQNISFKIIPLPNTEDGVYKVPVTIQYLNWIGDEREENETMSILVGSSPKLLVELTSSEIYRGNPLGNIKIKVINDNPGNVKFLKVNLGESTSYKILGSDFDYVGDLNSDDYSDVTFKISLNDDTKALELPISLSYKDALNKDYTQVEKIVFNVPTAKEAGIKKSYSWLYLLIIVLAVGGYIAYRRYNKYIAKAKKVALSIGSKF